MEHPLPHYVPQIQLHKSYLTRIARVIEGIPGCKLLVWGVGHDSKLWCAVNSRGTTVFVEDHPGWARMARSQMPCRVVMARYDTRRDQADDLIDAPLRLTLALPPDVLRTRFDVILIDAPDGSKDAAPGRMKSIFMSSRLAHDRSHVFLHDYHRPVEARYAHRYLAPRFGPPQVYKRRGWLAHFRRRKSR